MNYENLGNLGEFIGSVLVLVTLLILVFQVRQAQKTIASNSYLESARLFFELFDEAATNPFLSEALGKSRRGEPLTTGEEEACLFYYRSMFRRYEALYNLQSQGLISRDRLTQVGKRLNNSARYYPGVLAAWSLDTDTFDDAFRKWCESYLRDAGRVPPTEPDS